MPLHKGKKKCFAWLVHGSDVDIYYFYKKKYTLKAKLKIFDYFWWWEWGNGRNLYPKMLVQSNTFKKSEFERMNGYINSFINNLPFKRAGDVEVSSFRYGISFLVNVDFFKKENTEQHGVSFKNGSPMLFSHFPCNYL